MPIDQYNKLLDQLEDLDDIRAYDTAKAEDDEVIPFDQFKPLPPTPDHQDQKNSEADPAGVYVRVTTA